MCIRDRSGGNPAILAANMAELVTKLKERGVTLAVETQGSRWQNWLKDIDQVLSLIHI